MSQNILHRTRCYLSGHMEYADGRDWRDKVKSELSTSGIIFLDPYHKPFATSHPEDEDTRKMLAERRARGTKADFDFLNSYFKPVRSDDLRMCDISDFCMAHISPAIASWGTAEELVTTNRMKKPIFLAVEGGKKKCPLWIFGMIPHKYIYNSVDEMIEMVRNIDIGRVAIDSDRWRLLNKEIR